MAQAWMGSWIESRQLRGSALTTNPHCLSLPLRGTSSDMYRDLVSRTDPESLPKLTNLFQTTSLGLRCSIMGFPYTYITVLPNYMHYSIFISLSEAPSVDNK